MIERRTRLPTLIEILRGNRKDDGVSPALTRLAIVSATTLYAGVVVLWVAFTVVHP